MQIRSTGLSEQFEKDLAIGLDLQRRFDLPPGVVSSAAPEHEDRQASPDICVLRIECECAQIRRFSGVPLTGSFILAAEVGQQLDIVRQLRAALFEECERLVRLRGVICLR